MEAQTPPAGIESDPAETLFDSVSIQYEEAYGEDPALTSILHQVTAMLLPGSRILDVGCGTGKPVASTLAAAGMQVTGIDISQNMISVARKRVPGTFVKANMLHYEPSRGYDAVFMNFSHLQLSVKDFRSALLKYTGSLRPGGLFVLACVPSDNYITDLSLYDETGSYVENLPIPFMGHEVKVTLFTTKATLDLFRSLGMEIVESKSVVFQPKGEGFPPEDQLFVVARRTGNMPPKE